MLAFVSVPVRLTVPPVRLNAPNCAKPNVPPRFTVEFVEETVPVLDHEPLKLTILLPLAVICAPAAFVQLVGWTYKVATHWINSSCVSARVVGNRQ